MKLLQRFRNSIWSCLLCGLGLFIPLLSTHAETEVGPETEILIKGVPISQPLQKIPQSTTVVLEKTLAAKGSINIQDSMDSIPNLSWSGGTARPRFFLIRGVGELEQYAGAPNPSVATIVDGIDFSGLGVVTPLFDIEQIEVLRGPQGIQFGSSALAGALNIRSNDPTPYTTGILQIGSGNDDYRLGAAAIGGAVPGTNEKLQLRFSALSSYSDGFRQNEFLRRDDTNQREESFARLKIRYQPSSSTSIDLTGFVTSANNGYDGFTVKNRFHTQSDRPGRDDLQSNALSLKAITDLGSSIKVMNQLSYLDAKQEYSYDGDWGNNQFWGAYAPYDYFSDTGRTRRTLSNELRFYSEALEYQHGESYRWVAGAFLQRLTEGSFTEQNQDGIPYDEVESDYRANTAALFGQLEVPLANRTSLSFGVRHEQRTTDYDDSRGADFSPTFEMLGGNIVVAHDLSESVRGYISAARGFKGGGFNSGAAVPTERRQYDPEYLWSFETGVKGVWLDKRLTSNFAVFRELRRDQQLKLAIQDDPSDPLSFTYLTESSARGASTGVELENVFKMTPAVAVFLNGSVMESEITSAPVELQSLQGRSYSHAPSWQFSSGFDAQLGRGFSTRLEVTGRNGFYFDDSHNQRSDPYTLLNSSITWSDESWRITAWGRNLANESYAVRGFFFGNEPPDFPNKQYIQLGDPRAMGVTVSYQF